MQDTSSELTTAIHSVCSGIAPHRGRREGEEYNGNVPIWLRNRNGLAADDLAAILATDRPELGIESENDLMEALSGAALRRRDGLDYYRQEDTMTQIATPGMDPVKAREAVQDFAQLLEELDPAVVQRIQDAWKTAYLACGHKALGRYMVTSSLATACKRFDKMGTD